jgi:ATP-dependent Clp protease ATP-binding subunit ClpC
VFERFTDRARRAVVLAQEEARELGHNYIGTEHILLGLISEEDGVAARVLAEHSFLRDQVREQVREIVGQGAEGQAPMGHIPFTPRAKKVLELSLREALNLNHNYIGTEHILLGLIREGQGVAAQILAKPEGKLAELRQQVIEEARKQAHAESPAALGPFVGAGGPSMLVRIERLQQSLNQAQEGIILLHKSLEALHRRLDAMDVPSTPPAPEEPEPGPPGEPDDGLG